MSRSIVHPNLSLYGSEGSYPLKRNQQLTSSYELYGAMTSPRASPLVRQQARNPLNEDQSCITNGRGSAGMSTSRRRVNVACGRCRKRKIRCSGDPGDNSGCNACKSAGMAYGSCVFLRVQCEARELVPEQSGSSSAYASNSASYDSPATHQNLYEPLQNPFQPYMAASNTSEISPGPQLYRSRSSIGGTQRERIHQEQAILMNAPHLLSRSLPDKSLGNSRLVYSSTRQRMHEDSYPPTLHRRPLMHVPTSLELDDSPLSNSIDLSVTGANYPIRSLSQDASMMPSSYYETPWGSQLFNGGRSNSAHTLLYGQESTGVLSYPLLEYCSAASAKNGTSAPLEVDNSGPFPALGSLSSSLPNSSLPITSIPTSTISERSNPNHFSITISDKIALPAICGPSARPASPEFVDKSIATLGSNFQVTQNPTMGISVGSSEPSSIYGPQGKEIIQPYLIEPDLSSNPSSTKHNYIVSAPESHVRSTKPTKDHAVQMIRLSSSYPSISAKQSRIGVADKKSTAAPFVSSFPPEGAKEATKNDIGYSPQKDCVSSVDETNTFNSQSYTDGENGTEYKSLADDQRHSAAVPALSKTCS